MHCTSCKLKAQWHQTDCELPVEKGCKMHHLLFAAVYRLQDFMDCMWCSKLEFYISEDVSRQVLQHGYTCKKLTSTQSHAGLGQKQGESG